MRDTDQILLEEAMNQVEEGMFDRMKAKSGTRMASMGNKALGGISKMAGDTRLGKAAGELQQQGQEDVREQRAAQLMASSAQKVERLLQEFWADAKKLGLDMEQLKQGDMLKQGNFPKLAGLSKFVTHLNQAKESISQNG